MPAAIVVLGVVRKLCQILFRETHYKRLERRVTLCPGTNRRYSFVEKGQ